MCLSCAVSNAADSDRNGSIHGLIGPNGAGKTTIFNCISGVYKPNNGRLLFDGDDLTPLLPHQIAQLGIARTFQNIELFHNMTALDNVLVGQHVHMHSSLLASAFALRRVRDEERRSRERVQEILRFLHLADVQHHLASSLAFGHQKMLELGRALALEPTLLLLDEPSASLAPLVIEAIFATLVQMNADGITLLLVEQNVSAALAIADYVYVLRDGSIVTKGTPTALQQGETLQQAYLGSNVSVRENS